RRRGARPGTHGPDRAARRAGRAHRERRASACRTAGARDARRIAHRRRGHGRRSRTTHRRGRRDDRAADAMTVATGIALYDGTARDAAAVVVARYSTSFG